MKFLLDVNALLAAILAGHSRHQAVNAWLKAKAVATCPLTELGFIRISSSPKAYNVSMALARQSLEAFKTTHKTEFIPDDIPALNSSARSSGEVTDCYLAELASSKGLKLATLDTGIAHAASEIIS
jgi:toxin-antitoxin system PIN domain toxin